MKNARYSHHLNQISKNKNNKHWRFSPPVPPPSTLKHPRYTPDDVVSNMTSSAIFITNTRYEY